MLIDLLRTRWSVRQFQDKPIPEEILTEILEAGRLTPSTNNEQPWRFGVVTRRVLIEKLADAAHKQQWMAHAPLIIVLCAVVIEDERVKRDLQKRRFPRYAETIDAMDRDFYAALTMAEHQTKIAGTHMALTAWEHGIGCTWVSRFDVRQVADLLGVLDGWFPSEMLVLGYPAEPPKLMEKKPLDEIVFRARFIFGRR